MLAVLWDGNFSSEAIAPTERPICSHFLSFLLSALCTALVILNFSFSTGHCLSNAASILAFLVAGELS